MGSKVKVSQWSHSVAEQAAVVGTRENESPIYSSSLLTRSRQRNRGKWRHVRPVRPPWGGGGHRRSTQINHVRADISRLTPRCQKDASLGGLSWVLEVESSPCRQGYRGNIPLGPFKAVIPQPCTELLFASLLDCRYQHTLPCRIPNTIVVVKAISLSCIIVPHPAEGQASGTEPAPPIHWSGDL